MPRHDADALLSVAQAATLLGVHPNTIRTWTDAGRLTAYRINARGDRRYRQAEVARLLVEDAGDGTPAPPRPNELAVVSRVADVFATAPRVAPVARALVEALRAEVGLDEVAVYIATDKELSLAAHGGFMVPPPARRPTPGSSDEDDGRWLPLVAQRRTVAFVLIHPDQAAFLSAPFRGALGAVGGTTIAAAQRLARNRRQLQRVRVLRSVTKELTGTLDLGRVLDGITERTRTMFAADRAGIWLLDHASNPVPLVTRGLSRSFLDRGSTLTADSDTISVRALGEQRTLWARDAHRDPSIGQMREAYAAEGIRTVCIAPLISRGEALGVIGLYHDADRDWPEEEVDLVQAFADQAAVAIQNARLYRSTVEQAARMRSIQDLSARLNGLTDVRAIAEAIVAEARTLANYHDIRVYRVDRERGVCDPIAFTRQMLVGDVRDAEELLRVGIGEGFTGWVAEHGEPLLINDALDDDRGKTIDGTDDVPESMLVVPMLYEGRAVGVIVLSQLGFNRFTDDDLQTMSIFAGYAAQAMTNAATYEALAANSAELERRAESQRRLLEINERLHTALDQDGVLETIADGLRDVIRYDNLSIYRTDDVRQVMLPVLTRERHAEQVSRYIIPYGRGLMGWAVEHARSILANDALNDPRALQIPGTPPDPEAVAVIPLIADGSVIGALNVSRVGGPEVYFSETDFELIQLFAAQASIALRNADAHHAMRERADTDALTGLGNHGAFQRDLGRLVEEALTSAEGTRLSVLMMDLDRFKAYNDHHGHPAGDALLHRTATAIYSAARSDDRVYRYGGDEFALILPDATTHQAARVGQRIRRAVSGLTTRDPQPVTITIGVASLPGDAADRAGLVAAADAALYYGKRSGEDRVVRADGLASDVGGLRGTLEELATAALRESDDVHAVEHLVERAWQLTAPQDGTDTVRDALLVVSAALATHTPSGHPGRVGRLAAAVADTLGLPADLRSDLELAGRLHELDETSLDELDRSGSIRVVVTTIRGARTVLAAGARRARRISRPRGTTAAHVLAAAAMYDDLATGARGEPLTRDRAVAALREHPATFRSDVLDALAVAVGQRRDPGRRRRRGDLVTEEERGAA